MLKVPDRLTCYTFLDVDRHREVDVADDELLRRDVEGDECS